MKAALRVLVLVALVASWGFTTLAGLDFFHRKTAFAAIQGGAFWPTVVGIVASFAVQSAALARYLSGFADHGARRSIVRMRVAAYLIFAMMVVFWVSLQPFRRFDFDLALIVVGGLFGFTILAESWLERVLPTRLLRAADIVLLNVVICAVGLELGLRAYGGLRPSPIFGRIDKSNEARLEEVRYDPGFLRYGFPCNATGHYDTDFSPRGERPVVVSIGDSFAAGVVPHYFHFTTVCERAFDGAVDVYNLGAPSTGPAQYLYLLRYEGLPLEPDAVVINVFVGNDIVTKWQVDRRDRFLRSWLDRQNLLTYLVPKRLAAVAREAARHEREGRAVGELQGERQYEAPVLEGEQGVIDAFPWVADPFLEESNSSHEGLVRNETASATHAWTEEPASYAQLFGFFEAVREACGDIPVVIVLIPNRFQVEDDLYREIRERVPAVADRELPQRRIVAWLEERGFTTIDLLPRLRELEPLRDGRIHAYHRNDTHFNRRGNEVAGIAIAEVLREPLREALEKKD